jgi:hypothetical protein
MMSRLINTLAVAGVFLAATSGFAQNTDPAQNPGQNNPPAATSLRGKVVRVEGQDRIVVQTNDNKEVILYSTPTTRYVIDGKTARFADIRTGVNLNAAYNIQGDRYMVGSIQVGDATESATQPGGINERKFRGRVVKINAANNQIVAKSQNGNEVTLFVQKNGRFMRNGQVVTLADLQVGTVIESQYLERDGHWWVEEVTVVTDNAGADQPGAENTQVQGTVVRIVGQNQVIIRTRDNKEMTIELAPQTSYSFDNQPGQLRDVQPGQDVRVQYNTVERRTIASRIFGNRRK